MLRKHLLTPVLRNTSKSVVQARELATPNSSSNKMLEQTAAKTRPTSFTEESLTSQQPATCSLFQTYLLPRHSDFSQRVMSNYIPFYNFNLPIYTSRRFPYVLYIFVVTCIAGNRNKFTIHNSQFFFFFFFGDDCEMSCFSKLT